MVIYIFLIIVICIIGLSTFCIYKYIQHFMINLKKENEANILNTLNVAKDQLVSANYNQLREVSDNHSRVLQQVVNVNSTKLSEVADSNANKVQEVLNPFNKDLIEFKKRMEDININQTKHVGELSGKLDGVVQLYNKLSEETNNLTKALRGQIKLQGLWGEEILKKVLEASGLKKDTNYIEQAIYDTEEGRKRPDFVIKLPEDRDIIIDAKLSLNSYVNYYNADNSIDKLHFLNSMGDTFKKHVDTLANKEYSKINELKSSPKAVFIFIPIESIYLVLVDKFQSLVFEASQKNIYVTTTTTLMPLLQIIESMWKTHYQSKNTFEMSRIAGKIYDKFSGILEDFDKMRDYMHKADKQLDNIKIKFTGKDSLVRNVEKLGELGANNFKKIPNKWKDDFEEDLLGPTLLGNENIVKENKIE